jgi:hypothetical protein
LLAAVLFALPAGAQLPGVYASGQVARPRWEPRCVLDAVAKQMHADFGRHRPPEVAGAILNAAKKTPRVRYQSSTPLAEFQRAVAKQAPGIAQFSNMYSLETGEVFLLDDASYYSSVKRDIADSLAHEFVHHIQVAYLGYTLEDLQNDDSAEGMAVQYQTWFRDEYVKGGKPLACPAN